MRTRTLGILLSVGLGLSGCVVSETVIGDGPDGSGASGGSGGGGGSSFDADPRLDLLIVVDNSISMTEKQERFVVELDRLLRSISNPPCLAEDGAIVEANGECPSGTARAFAPVRDIHLGVISSSLGDLTTGACGGAIQNPDDKGRLLTRGRFGGVDTYQDLGFLVFDPDAAMSPPGETSIDAFIERAQELVLGAGGLGCGYEMPLEAMMRFLVDPTPYESLETDEATLTTVGVDQVVLDQRDAFLRDTSNLAVIVLSDENDCSVAVETQGFLALKGPFYRATAICETAPESPCCTSCGLAPPEGCEPDPTCATNPKYTAAEDHPNLKCVDQKRKYGIEFTYPTARYVNALSAVEIDPGAPSLVGLDLVPNPLFAGGRHPNQVTLQTVIGVPWQNIVSDPESAESPTLTPGALSEAAAWEWMTGNAPTDPFMRESVDKRVGVSPTTGESVTAENGINGGDRTISENDGVQYACTFPLDAGSTENFSCQGCTESSCDNPICDGTTQIASWATPGLRQMDVVRGLGDRGAVGSICRDPAVAGSAQALVARLAQILP